MAALVQLSGNGQKRVQQRRGQRNAGHREGSHQINILCDSETKQDLQQTPLQLGQKILETKCELQMLRAARCTVGLQMAEQMHRDGRKRANCSRQKHGILAERGQKDSSCLIQSHCKQRDL